MGSHVIIEKADVIATVRLNRPAKHNAFDEHLIEELSQAFRDLATDSSVRVVVLAANGQSFSAGADLDWMKRMAGMSRGENEKDSLLLADLMAAIDRCPKPVVGIVDGAAFGGGVGLVACGRVVAGDARFAGHDRDRIGAGTRVVVPAAQADGKAGVQRQPA